MRLIQGFLLVFFLGLTVIASAQNIQNIDFSAIKVDQLSDQQIQRIAREIESRGITMTQFAELAVAQGMPRSEVIKLQRRINESSLLQDSSLGGIQSVSRLRSNPLVGDSIQNQLGAPASSADTATDMPAGFHAEFAGFMAEQDSIRLREQMLKRKIFGFGLFTGKSSGFEPFLNIPTPVNYQLGPGDQVIVDIWGAAENTYLLEISPDGSVVIENVGPVFLNGLTIDEARQRLRDKLSSIYSGLQESKGQRDTFMQVSLGQIRSIKVTVLGEASNPGTYTLPSLATVFNGLLASGGPTVDGTFREIKVIRGDSLATTLDLYDFLIKGRQTNNIRLKDQDIIKIDPYLHRVEISGEVKRPAIYELKEDETLSELIAFSGGFTGDAYKAKVNIIGNTGREKMISTVDKKNYDTYNVRNGDQVMVGSILDRFANRVTIQGAVYRPGNYELEESPTLHALIQQADGLKGDAFMNRGIIYRTNDDFTIQSIAFDVRQVVNNPGLYDISLKKDDIIQISSIFDLREDYHVEIEGAVLNEGRIPFIHDMTLEDLIFQAGGFRREAAPYRIEVARRMSEVSEEGEEIPSSQIAKIFDFSVDQSLELDEEESNFVLKPFDKVFVRTTPNFETQKDVYVSGEVQYPGSYTLMDKSERISDIIARAGGLTSDSYLRGATLYRRHTDLSQAGNATLENPTGLVELDTANGQLAQPGITLSKIGIELEKIVNAPGSKFDLYLQEGDSLVVPKQLQTVLVKGGVFYPTSVRYEEGRSYKDYITSAGGFNELAKKNQAYIVYANGDVDRTKTFLFLKDYPEVRPGATIVVPEKTPGQRMSPQERVSLLSAIVSTAALISTTIIQITR